MLSKVLEVSPYNEEGWKKKKRKEGWTMQKAHSV